MIDYDLTELRVTAGHRDKSPPGKGRETVVNPSAVTGYWWDNDSLYRHNHLIMENGKDFHNMTDEEYYNEDQ